MQYRGFTIEQQFIYCDPFTKVPNGLFDGMWYHEDWEIARGIYRETLSNVKRDIDDYIYEHIEYRVNESPFFYLEEAIAFCKTFSVDISNIRMLFNGEEIQFDSI